MVWRILSRIQLISLIADIAYELIRFGAADGHHPLIRAGFAYRFGLITAHHPRAKRFHVGGGHRGAKEGPNEG